MSGVSKLVRDDEQWSWVTQIVSFSTPYAGAAPIAVIFPTGVPTERIVAIRFQVWTSTDGTETAVGEPCLLELYRVMASSKNAWPNNTIPWRLTMRSGEQESIVWTPLPGWGPTDQIGIYVTGGNADGADGVSRVVVSILVKTSFC